MFDLNGKTALVTGGSRGLGLAMARALGQAGAQVVITARKADELEQARNELSELDVKVDVVQSDLGNRESLTALVDNVLERHGAIDILVNNAGTTWGAAAEDYPEQAWDKVIEVNLSGTWLLTQMVAKRSMIARKQGSIIMVASVLGMCGNAPGGVQTVAYNTSKAGQINLARALAGEWGRYGIRVNSLLPGWFPTRMSHGTLDEHAGMLQQMPLGRFGTDQDLAGPILFLASDASRYVTGHALSVDGGMLAVM